MIKLAKKFFRGYDGINFETTKFAHHILTKIFITFSFAVVLCVSVVLAGNWSQQGDNWFYMNNGVPMTGLQQIDNKIYYFNESGVMTVGPQFINGKWFFFNDDKDATDFGGLQQGICSINGISYTINTDGSIVGYNGADVGSTQLVFGQTKVVNGINYEYQNTPAGPQWVNMDEDEEESDVMVDEDNKSFDNKQITSKPQTFDNSYVHILGDDYWDFEAYHNYWQDREPPKKGAGGGLYLMSDWDTVVDRYTIHHSFSFGRILPDVWYDSCRKCCFYYDANGDEAKARCFEIEDAVKQGKLAIDYDETGFLYLKDLEGFGVKAWDGTGRWIPYPPRGQSTGEPVEHSSDGTATGVKERDGYFFEVREKGDGIGLEWFWCGKWMGRSPYGIKNKNFLLTDYAAGILTLATLGVRKGLG